MRARPNEAADEVALTERRIRRSLLLGAAVVAVALVATFLFFQLRTERLIAESIGMSGTAAAHEVAQGRALTAVALVGSLATLLFVLYLIVTRLLKAMLNAERRLDELASYDSLTGLTNRRVAVTRLYEEIHRADRVRMPLGLLMIDLDHFKDVNDTHGHHVGDAVLIAAGYAISSEAREYDIVARMGGEEFLVLLPGTDAVAATAVAERIRRRISETTVLAVPELAAAVTASVGVAVHLPGATEDPEEALVRADRALYAAKRRGRDRVMVA